MLLQFGRESFSTDCFWADLEDLTFYGRPGQHVGRANTLARALTKWTKACDNRSAKSNHLHLVLNITAHIALSGTSSRVANRGFTRTHPRDTCTIPTLRLVAFSSISVITHFIQYLGSVRHHLQCLTDVLKQKFFLTLTCE